MRNFSLRLSIVCTAWLILLIQASFASAAERGLSRNQPSANGVYRAIVIGNNRYKDPERVWRPLKTAVNDAKAVASLLKKSYGFTDVQLLENATRRQILVALSKVNKRVGKKDSVLVYYAGHGYQDKKSREAFWIPVDVEGEDDSFYLSNVRIKEKLSIIADTAQHTLLISDSCFSGSLLDASRGRRNALKSNNNYIRKVSSRKSVQILAAGGKEFVDDNYRGSGHSPFTYFLLKELDTNDQRNITLANLALNIEELVAINATQTPQSGPFRQAGDEGGQFIFRKTDIKTTPIAKPKPKPTTIANSNHMITNEFSDWKTTNQNSASSLLAYINKYPDGSITEVAKVKYDIIFAKIDTLLTQAKRDFYNDRLISPPKENAKDRYLAILKIDGQSIEANNGLVNVANSLLDNADKHVRNKRFDKADNLINEAEKIAPSLSQIRKLRGKISRNRRAIEEKHQQKILAQERAIEEKGRNKAMLRQQRERERQERLNRETEEVESSYSAPPPTF